MVTIQIQISDDLNHDLQEVAARNGSTPEDFIREVVQGQVVEELFPHAKPTEAQVARMRRSLDQLNRGEVITSEEVDQRFEEWHKPRSAR